MARPINIKLILDALGYVRGAKKAGTATKDLGKNINRLDGVTSKLKGGLLKLGAQFTALFGLMRLLRSTWQTVTDSISKATVQQITEEKLSQAIRNAGDAAEEQLPKFKALASSLQDVTNFGDDAIMTGQSLLLAVDGLGSEGVRKLTPAMLDLSAAMQKVDNTSVDLTTTARLMAQIMAGNTGSLTRYGISLNEVEKHQLEVSKGMDRVNVVAAIVEKRFGGLAESMADPFKQMKNDVGDLQEVFGLELLPVLREVAEEIREWVKHPDTIDSVRGAAVALSDAIRDVVTELEDANSSTRKLLRALGELGSLLAWINEAGNKTAAVLQDLQDGAAALGTTARMMLNLGPGVIDLDKWVASLGKTAVDTTDNLRMLQAQANEVAGMREFGVEPPEPPAPFVPPVELDPDIKKREFARRELEITLMRESEERIRAEVALEFDKRREQFRTLFKGLPSDVASMLDELEEMTEAELVRKFRVSLIVDVETPDVELPEFELELPETELDDLRDLVEGSLFDTVLEADSLMAQLNEAFDKADTQQAREEIGALIDTLAGARERMTAGMKDLRIDMGELANDLVSGVAEAIGSGENIGDALLQTLGALAVKVGKLAVAFGVAGIGIKKIATANPVAAVIAGAALIALGKRAQAAVAKAVGSESTESAGGSATGTTFSGGVVLDKTVVLPGRATGGPVRGGTSVVVGEHGVPEIFTAKESGFILPAAAIASDVALAFGNPPRKPQVGSGASESQAMAASRTGDSGASGGQIAEVVHRFEMEAFEVNVGIDELAIRIRQRNETENRLLGRDG